MVDRYMPYMIPVLLVVMGIIYFIYDPLESPLFPKCPWYMITGTQCPSCGIQRFLFQFLHGNFREAFLLNPFLMVSFPYALLAVLGKWYNFRGIFNSLNRFLYHRYTLIAYTILFFMWWIVRNILSV